MALLVVCYTLLLGWMLVLLFTMPNGSKAMRKATRECWHNRQAEWEGR